MDEILLLQQQLMAVQNSSTLYKLANRNVMEIVDLLTKKYGLVLYFTSDGREFIVPEYLDGMIVELVNEHGRISVVELPNLLNIGLGIIEVRVEALLKKSNLQLIDAVLISATYLDKLAEEINEILQVEKELKFADLAVKYELPTNVITKEIINRVGNFIVGEVSPDSKRLVTKGYQLLVKNRLLGILKAQSMPRVISTMSKTYKLDSQTLEAEIKLLIEQKELKGAVRGGFYIPDKFLEQKDLIIKSTFLDQGFINFDWIEKTFLEKKPKELAQKILKGNAEGIYLKSCVLSKRKLEEIKEKAGQILESDGFCENTTLFPSSFDDEDIETILNEHIGLQGLIIESNLLILTSFLEKCVLKMRERLIEVIEEQEKVTSQAPKAEGKKKKADPNKFPLTQAEVLKYLDEKNIMAYIVDSDMRESVYGHLKTLLEEDYIKLREELLAKKNMASSDLITDLNTKIEHLGLSIQYCSKTIKSLVETSESFNPAQFEQLSTEFILPLVERIIFFNLKRFKIAIEPTTMVQKKSAQLVLPEFDHHFQPVFANGVSLEGLVDRLPKESRPLLKELVEISKDKNIPKIAAFLEEKAVDLGLNKIQLNKKTEKVFAHAFKYFAEEKLKVEEDITVRVCLFLALVVLGEGLFIWPVFTPRRDPAQHKPDPREILKLQAQILGMLKGKFSPEHWQGIEALQEIGFKSGQQQAIEAPELKTLFKNLNRLI